MVYAIDENGLRIPAMRGMRAKCPCCRETVLARCGDLKVWHWAHADAPLCDPWWESETEWHLSWKRHVPPERAEVPMGEHRADLLAPDGAVVELQHSPISIQEIHERERFYGPKMIWLLDGEVFRGNFRVQRVGDGARFHWSWPRLTWLYAKRPVFIHGFVLGTLLQGPNTVTGKIEPRFQFLFDSHDVFQIRTSKRRPYATGEGRIIPLAKFKARMMG